MKFDGQDQFTVLAYKKTPRIWRIKWTYRKDELPYIIYKRKTIRKEKRVVHTKKKKHSLKKGHHIKKSPHLIIKESS